MSIAIPQVITDRSGAQVIDGSLKFDAGKSEHLKRTPGSTGNRRTWTWAAWVKRTVYGADKFIFSAGSDASNQHYLRFKSDNTLEATEKISDSTQSSLITNAVHRDTGWYHLVYVFDSAQSASSDRVCLYVNGVKQTSLSTNTYPSQNHDSYINNTSAHYIGSSPLPSAYYDGSISNVYLIDGLALGPEYFGYTDPLTNIWKPKKFKAEGTTYNDGTVWSSGSTVTGGSISNAADGFDGDLSSSGAHCTLTSTDTSTTANVTFAVNFKNVTKVEVFVHSASSSGDTRGTCETPNGVTFTSPTLTSASQSFHTIYEGEPIRLKNIGWGINQNGQTGTVSDAFRAFRINGEILIDSTTRNLSFGTNGFYLPMDGNSLIGQDKSGQGNDWAPVNVGGSAALDNPQVSGAKPILNTLPGGTQAGVGVFGSKQNVGYAVTVYDDGGGNKYYIDGVKQATLTGLIRGATYTFDTSDSTIGSTHPFRLSATSAHGTEYTNGVAAITGTATTITIPYDAPESLYYYCTAHSGMGSSITGITTNEKLADQYASHCTLALPLFGSDDDVCASIACTANNKTPTNSSVTASTTQSNFYGGSHHWSANSDTLQYAEQGDELVLGTGDFTIEFWYFDDGGHSGTGGRTYLFDNRIGGSVTGDPPTLAGWLDGVEVNLYITGGGGTISYNGSVENKWHHYAAVRSGTTVTLYHDGVARGTMTSSTNFTNNGIGVGRATDANYGMAGYIQDFRVYKGVAKYTSDFVIPATSPDILPDTPSGVSGGSKLTKITDGAVSFDGTGDDLHIADSADFEFGTGDFTIECFAYHTVDSDDHLISKYGSSNATRSWRLVSDGNQKIIFYWYYSTDSSLNITSAAGKFSLNRWHHIVAQRTSGDIYLFVDGELVGSNTSSGAAAEFNDNSTAVAIAGDLNGSSQDFPGFISNVRIVKGTGVYSTLGFTPPTAPLTNVTNTKLLCCQSNTSATEAAVTPGSITANGDAAATNFNPFNTDINTVRGQETGYCTLNPLWKNSNSSNSGGTFTDGNLNHTTAGSNGNTPTCANIYASSGKFYWEVTLTSGSAFGIGVASDIFSSADYPGYGTGAANGQVSWGYNQNGVKIHNATSTSSYGSSYTVGDTIGVAMNLDTGELEYYKNGVSQGVAFTDLEGNLTACHADTGSAAGFSYNFGQKPFKFAPPDGFQPLNTANTRPVKVVARPDQYVGVATYTGTGSAFDINYNFSPDFAWVKGSSYNGNHQLCDSVRNGQAGGNRRFELPGTANQDGGGPGFINSGLNINTNAAINTNNEDYVAWCWKAGGAPTADNTQTSGAMTANSVSVDGALQSAYTPSGSPSTYPKRMSVGTDQGFSIVLFEGNASNRTLPHGLGKPAKFMIVKNMDTDSTGWAVYHDAIGTATNNYIELQATTAAGADDTAFQDTAPTSDVFSIGTKAAVNNDTDDTIAYIWADVPGMQKFGQFTGNSSADGVFVELGFKPAILLIKNDNSTGDWIIWDNERNKINPVDRQLWPYTNTGTYGAYDQVASSYPLDFLSNGFKIRTTDADMNSSSRTYIYAAWAEAPSVDLFGGGANAR